MINNGKIFIKMSESINLFPYPKNVELKKGIRGKLLTQELDPKLSRNDEYELIMSENGTVIRAGSESGMFYAKQTLSEISDDKIGFVHDWADVPLRIQMIDLKRIGWNFDYLLSLFPLFAKLKINCCLIEYEDKFPYKFAPEIPVKGAFSREQIKKLVQVAEANHVEIIPLVQCFSHWEYILKLPRFHSLREQSSAISQGCPLNPKTRELFCSMLKEIIELHPNSRYIHIGGDEARLLGKCPACAQKVRELGVETLWGDYIQSSVNEVLSYGKTPLFWADFFWYHDGPKIQGDVIAIDWEYKQKSYRSQEIWIGGKSFSWGDKLEKRYKNCWRQHDSSHTLWGFPHQLWLKEQGYRCWGGSVANSPDNILAHAVAATLENNGAVLDTYWASFDSTTPPSTIFPWNLAGVGMLGAAAWNSQYELNHRSDFEQRLARKLSGQDCCSEVYNFLNIAPMQFSKAPKIFGGKHAVWSEKKQFDFSMQKLLKHNLLFPESCYEKIPLNKYFNSDLNFNIAGEKCSFTIGNLNFMPQGKQIISGIPFDFYNNLIVYGKYTGQKNIPPSLVLEVKSKHHPEVISVIQSYVGNESEIPQIGKVIFHYREGNCTVPLILNQNIHNWWGINNMGENRIAFSNDNLCASVRLGLHCWNCPNPHPDWEIQKIEFQVTTNTVIALAAVTLLEKSAPPNAQSVEQIVNLDNKLIQLKSSFQKEFLRYSTVDSAKELDHFAFAPHENYLKLLQQLV